MCRQANTFYLVERICAAVYPVRLNGGTFIAKRKV